MSCNQNWRITFSTAAKEDRRALLSVAANKHRRSHTIPELSQQEWASMIGVTRQRVNALMQKFRKLGYIDSAERRIDSLISKFAGNE